MDPLLGGNPCLDSIFYSFIVSQKERPLKFSLCPQEGTMKNSSVIRQLRSFRDLYNSQKTEHQLSVSSWVGQALEYVLQWSPAHSANLLLSLSFRDLHFPLVKGKAFSKIPPSFWRDILQVKIFLKKMHHTWRTHVENKPLVSWQMSQATAEDTICSFRPITLLHSHADSHWLLLLTLFTVGESEAQSG